jgi:hypothetical protein
MISQKELKMELITIEDRVFKIPCQCGCVTEYRLTSITREDIPKIQTIYMKGRNIFNQIPVLLKVESLKNLEK